MTEGDNGDHDKARGADPASGRLPSKGPDPAGPGPVAPGPVSPEDAGPRSADPEPEAAMPAAPTPARPRPGRAEDDSAEGTEGGTRLSGHPDAPQYDPATAWATPDGMIAAAQAIAFDSLPVDLMHVALDGRILSLNRIAAKTFGLRQSDPRPFPALWTESEEVVIGRLARVLGSSAWQTLGFTRRAEVPFRVPFRGRGLPPADGQIPSVLLSGAHPMLRGADPDDPRLAELRHETARLTEALATERRLHRGVVHRARNSIALLASLVRIGGARATSTDTARALVSQEHRTMTIGLVHRVLDQASGGDEVAAADLIEPICSRLSTAMSGDGSRLQIRIGRRQVQAQDATPLALAANELVMAALRRRAAQPVPPGPIAVALQDDPVTGRTVLSIHDPAFRDATALPDGAPGVILGALAKQLAGRIGAETGAWRLEFAPADPLPADMRV